MSDQEVRLVPCDGTVMKAGQSGNKTAEQVRITQEIAKRAEAEMRDRKSSSDAQSTE